MMEFKFALCSNNNNKNKLQEKPSTKIYRKINKDTCGGRLVWKKGMKQKVAVSGAAYKVANQFNSCGGLNSAENTGLGHLLSNKYRHLVSELSVLPTLFYSLHSCENHFFLK